MGKAQEFWSSEEGVLIRLEDLAHDFSFRTYNGAVQGVIKEAGISRFRWISVQKLGITCEYCWNQHGRKYRRGQFLPRIPAHPHCMCGWDILIEAER